MAAGQASRGGGKAPAPKMTWRAKIPDAAEAPEEKPTAALDTLAPKPSSAPKAEPEEPKKEPEAKKEAKGKKAKGKSKAAQEPKSKEPKPAPAEPAANDDDDDDEDYAAALQEARGGESSSEWLFVERGNALGVHAAGKLSKPGANEALLQILERTLKKRKAEKKAVVLRDLDVSRNRNFSTSFISKLLDLLTTYNVAVQRIRFYGSKKFDDAAIKILAKYLGSLEKSRVPFELHLSDCAITATGFAALLKSVTTNASFPYQEPSSGRLRPLYLRVENNYIGKDTIKEWLASPKVHAISKTGNLRRRQEQPTAKTRVQLLVLPDGVCPQKSGNPPRTQETSAAPEASASSRKGKSDEKKVEEKTPKYKEKKPAEAQEKVEEAQPAKATKSQGKEKHTAAEEVLEEKPAKGKGKGKQAVEAPEAKPEEQPVKGKAKSKAKALPDKAPEPAPKAKAKAAAKAEAKAAAKAAAKAEAEAKAAAKAAAKADAKASAKATAKAAAKEKAGKKEKDSGKDQAAAKAKAAAEDKKKGKKKGEAAEPDQGDLPEEKPVKGKGKGKAKVEEVPEEKAAEGKGRGKGKAEKGKAKPEEKPKWRRTSAGVDTGDACQPSTAIATDRRVTAETTTAAGERTAEKPSAADVPPEPPREEKKEKSEPLSAEAEAEAGTGEATSLPLEPTEAEAGTGEAGTAAEEAALTSGAAESAQGAQPAGADCKGDAAELGAGATSVAAGDVREALGDETEQEAASCAGTVGAALGPESSKQGGEDVDHSTSVVGTEAVGTEENSKSLSVACVLSRVHGLKAAAAAGLASKHCNANASSSCAASSMEEPLESSSVTSQVFGESSSTTASRQGISSTVLLSRVDHLRAAVAWFKSLRPPGQALHLREALRLIDDCPAVEKGCAEARGEWYSLLERSAEPMKAARRIISMAEALWRQGYLGPTREAKPAERARPQRSKSVREEELLRDLPLSSVCKSGSIKPGETGWVHTYRL